MSLSIRPINFEIDSLKELTELLHRAYKEHAQNGMKYLASYQDEIKTKERCNEGHCLLAFKDNRIVGTITINHPENSCGIPYYEKNGVTSFHQFGIDPLLQSTGLGSKLLNEAENYALKTGLRELAFDTSERALDLIKFYEKRGYCLVDECKWDHTNYKSLIYSKLLA